MVAFAWVELDSSYHLRCTIESVRDYKAPAVRGVSDATGCPVGRAPQAQGAERINRNERHKRQRNAATIDVAGPWMLRFIPRPPAFVGMN